MCVFLLTDNSYKELLCDGHCAMRISKSKSEACEKVARQLELKS